MHFRHYLYGHRVTILTDHTPVKAVLETENPSPKHARWWTRVYGRGLKSVNIQYRAGRENRNADALSRSPNLPPPVIGTAEDEVQVSTVTADQPQSHPDMETQGKLLSFASTVRCLPEDNRDEEVKMHVTESLEVE